VGSLSIWHWIIVLLVVIPTVIVLLRSKKKVCPQCAESVRAAALKCRYCGYRFPQD
jgi:tRNA(Ile2) C34 agmatinyltransferase TiaS